MNLNDFKTEWISDRIDERTVTFADSFGKHLCDITPDNRIGRMAMTTTQIRNVFGEVKRIEARMKANDYDKERSAFLLLRPKMAYAEARVLSKSGKSNISDFRKIMDKAHIEVKSHDSFKNFVDFFEAILAYHKFYGGRD
jgi:CRISPR-associated protein Csm2